MYGCLCHPEIKYRPSVRHTAAASETSLPKDEDEPADADNGGRIVEGLEARGLYVDLSERYVRWSDMCRYFLLLWGGIPGHSRAPPWYCSLQGCIAFTCSQARANQAQAMDWQAILSDLEA
jgi:hypothetical protein